MQSKKKHEDAQFLPECSVFPNAMTPTPHEGAWRFDLFARDIIEGKFKHLIDEIRAIDGKELRNEKKKFLPALTPSGVFSPTRSNANLVKPSGLMGLDFDDVVDLEKVLALLKQDEYSYFVFLSPSGTGIKVFVRIPPDPSRHKKLFKGLREYFKKKYGIEADERCSDISRLCYVSSDPDAQFNPQASVFNIGPTSAVKGLDDFTGDAEDFPVEKLYWTKEDEYGNVKAVGIKHLWLHRLIELLGFKRLDVEGGYLLVKVENNIIYEVHRTALQDALFNFLKNLPEELPGGAPREMLREQIFKTPENYFSEWKLSLLTPLTQDFCTDTATEVYYFYANGFVLCTKEGYSLKPYSELQGLVWGKLVLKRSFESAPTNYDNPETMPDFAKFVWNIGGKEHERFKAIRTIIGYLLHNYFEETTKAVLLTDSDLSPVANGRTGKTLFAKALGHISLLCELNGKDFDPDDRFKYQNVNMPDRIVLINDLKKNLNIEKLFNDITEGLSVQKKNKQPFRKLVRIVLASNRPLKLEGASAKDRVMEFEFSNHYSDKLEPKQEFGKWFFGTDFTAKDWCDFDNFMLSCVRLYLEVGVVTPSQINLSRRKLQAAINEDFLDFLDSQVKEGCIRANMVLCKHDLRDRFLAEYPDYQADLKDVSKVSTWLRAYANLGGIFAPNNSKQDEKAGGGKKYFVFRPIDYKRPEGIQFISPPVEEVPEMEIQDWTSVGQVNIG